MTDEDVGKAMAGWSLLLHLIEKKRAAAAAGQPEAGGELTLADLEWIASLFDQAVAARQEENPPEPRE